MKTRCYNENDKHYKNYGARGISISDVWLIFENFKDWARDYNINVNSENEDTLFDEYCRNDNGTAVKNYLDDYIFFGGGVLV